jgi:hypothetical protein
MSPVERLYIAYGSLRRCVTILFLNLGGKIRGLWAHCVLFSLQNISCLNMLRNALTPINADDKALESSAQSVLDCHCDFTNDSSKLRLKFAEKL